MWYFVTRSPTTDGEPTPLFLYLIYWLCRAAIHTYYLHFLLVLDKFQLHDYAITIYESFIIYIWFHAATFDARSFEASLCIISACTGWISYSRRARCRFTLILSTHYFVKIWRQFDDFAFLYYLSALTRAFHWLSRAESASRFHALIVFNIVTQIGFVDCGLIDIHSHLPGAIVVAFCRTFEAFSRWFTTTLSYTSFVWPNDWLARRIRCFYIFASRVYDHYVYLMLHYFNVI